MQLFSRAFQILLVVLVVGPAAAQVRQITPDVAREMALAGEIILIDIRQPGEWVENGLADVALTAPMRDADFLKKLTAIRDQNPTIPLALICQTGGRSGFMSRELYGAGLTGVIDVVEGMGGSDTGPGWLARALPTRPADAPVNPAILARQP